jgi:hypothetical protein
MQTRRFECAAAGLVYPIVRTGFIPLISSKQLSGDSHEDL